MQSNKKILDYYSQEYHDYLDKLPNMYLIKCQFCILYQFGIFSLGIYYYHLVVVNDDDDDDDDDYVVVLSCCCFVLMTMMMLILLIFLSK